MFLNLVCAVLLVCLLAGCHSVSSRPSPLVSPEAVIGAFRRCILAGDTQGLWNLYSEELKNERGEGWAGLQDWLSDSTITDVRIRHREHGRLADGYVTYHVAIAYGADDPVQRGNTLLSRVIVSKQEEHWSIQRIDPDYE